MRRSPLLLLLLLLPAAVWPKVYYASKGVKYHVGDDRFGTSLDSAFLDAYPVVGKQWIQAFTVSGRDAVKVRIDHIWGVDDCPYCKAMVSIDEHDMGRLAAENNHKPFDTPEPLAYIVEPGRTHYLKIESYGSEGRADDFMVEGVSVETDKAELVFLQPGPVMKMPEDPMPVLAPPAPVVKSEGPCGDSVPNHNWLLGFSDGQPTPYQLSSDGKDFAAGKGVAVLSPGQSQDLAFQMLKAPVEGDRVGQALEIRLGPVKGGNGWSLLFAPGQDQLQHANLISRGNYSPKAFQPAYRPGAWNQVQVRYCRDGSAQLMVNGEAAGPALHGLTGPQALSTRLLGGEMAFRAGKP